jgi:hypothetical protein
LRLRRGLCRFGLGFNNWSNRHWTGTLWNFHRRLFCPRCRRQLLYDAWAQGANSRLLRYGWHFCWCRRRSGRGRFHDGLRSGRFNSRWLSRGFNNLVQMQFFRWASRLFYNADRTGSRRLFFRKILIADLVSKLFRDRIRGNADVHTFAANVFDKTLSVEL